MRKVIGGVFPSLDGVIEGPGGPSPADEPAGAVRSGWARPQGHSDRTQARQRATAEGFW